MMPGMYSRRFVLLFSRWPVALENRLFFRRWAAFAVIDARNRDVRMMILKRWLRVSFRQVMSKPVDQPSYHAIISSKYSLPRRR